ncbi:unnamed protein product [Ectocarpus sp. CCAP 1310/34]|nr:unnamed protein product [Ectocarpus sp. CCAP 1310/34]
MKALTRSLKTLSKSVLKVQQQGSSIQDEELCELVAGFNIEPGKAAVGDAVNTLQAWATIEDDDEVVKVFRQDAVDDMTAQVAGSHVSPGSEEEDEEGDDEEEGGSDDENAGRGRRAPPGYPELSSHFGYLEAAAEGSGNRDALCHLSKARMAMIAAHNRKASSPGKHAGIHRDVVRAGVTATAAV